MRRVRQFVVGAFVGAMSSPISWALIVSLLALPGCSTLTRTEAVPAALEDDARIPLSDVPGALRYRVGSAGDRAALASEFTHSWTREREHLTAQGYRGPLPATAFLALSGGGDQGAFGARVLNGWTAAGDRPQFKLVTGISTGALIAPFAFLGPAYDGKLKALYTNISSKDVLKLRGYLAGLTSDAMADTEPLRGMLRKHWEKTPPDYVSARH